MTCPDGKPAWWKRTTARPPLSSPLPSLSSPWPSGRRAVNAAALYRGGDTDWGEEVRSTEDTAGNEEGSAGQARVAALQRWEALGAVWRVVSKGPSGVTVALYRCDGGEEVERFHSREPELIAFLGDRLSSES